MGGLAVDFPPTGIEVAAAWRCGVVLPNARVILLHNQVLYHGVCTPLVVCRALQRENAEEEIRLKILQTLPLLLASASYVVSPMFVSQSVDVCFHFLSDKSPIIQHTAEATVRQVWAGGCVRSHPVSPCRMSTHMSLLRLRGAQLVTLLFERLQSVATQLPTSESATAVEGGTLLLEVSVCYQRRDTSLHSGRCVTRFVGW